MPRTIGAADHLSRSASAPDFRRKVAGLLQALAALSAARGVVYLGRANLTGPLAVLAVYAAAGTMPTFAATAWRRHRPASCAPQHVAQAAGAAPSLAS